MRIKRFIILLSLILTGFTLGISSLAYADTCDTNGDGVVSTQEAIQCGAGQGGNGETPGQAGGHIDNLIHTLVNILTAIVGIAAVIMIIVGGFRYITSGGVSEKVSSAKNTILYAIIGLIIVALAQIIVKFVFNNVSNTQSNTPNSVSQGAANSPH